MQEKAAILAGLGKQRMVKEFEDACFKGPLNQVQKPVKTSYGYHIIKVTDATNDSYIVEKLVNKIEVSATTTDNLYNNATDFAYIANENGFEVEAKKLGYQVIESGTFTEEAGAIPGVGVNKGLVKFVFDGSVGDISEVFRVPSGHIVCMISNAEKAGFRPLEELKANLKFQVLREMKIEKAMKIAADIKNKIGGTGDINSAVQFYPQVTVKDTVSFTPGGSIPLLGREYAYINYAVEGKINQISEPIKGTRGAFLIKVTDRTEFDKTAYSVQRNSIRDNLLQFKKARLISEWLQKIKKEADIVDNRYKFYR